MGLRQMPRLLLLGRGTPRSRHYKAIILFEIDLLQSFSLDSPESLVASLRAESILSLASDMVACLVDHGGAPELALVVPLLGAGVEGLPLPGEGEHAGLSC